MRFFLYIATPTAETGVGRVSTQRRSPERAAPAFGHVSHGALRPTELPRTMHASAKRKPIRVSAVHAYTAANKMEGVLFDASNVGTPVTVMRFYRAWPVSGLASVMDDRGLHLAP